MRGSSVSYNPDNQISSNTYDGNGNPIGYFSNTLSFDPENRMTAFGSAETNTYDGDDHRASIQTSAGTSYYVFDGNEPILTEDNNGSITDVVTIGVNGVASSHTTSSGFYNWDPHGTLTQKLDSTGTPTYSREYDSFGDVTKTDSDADSFASFGGQWGYFNDTATGLYQLGHRFYDPLTGRFLTRDPLSPTTCINAYSYARNKPTVMVDPTGYVGVIAIGIGIIGGGGVVDPITDVIGGVVIGAGIVILMLNNTNADSDSDTTTDTPSCPDNNNDCAKEWANARAFCNELWSTPGTQPDPFGVQGNNYDQCVRGQVSERCGGNPISTGSKNPRKPIRFRNP